MIEWEKEENKYWKTEEYFIFPFKFYLSTSKAGYGLQGKIDFPVYNYLNGEDASLESIKKGFEEYIEHLKNLQTHEKRLILLEKRLSSQQDYIKRLEDKLERMENVLYLMNPPLTYEI